jgi:UDP-glucuronate 4-epimerase
MAHSYAAVHQLPLTGLRFFTVYGPYGRPDMALFKFTKRILANQEIDVYNYGQLSRDFTYITDIVDGIVHIISHIPKGKIPFEVFNIGRGEPIALKDFIEALEKATGKKAKRNNMPMQAGDVEQTFANTKKLQEIIHYKPQTELTKGVAAFVDWYRTFYL